MIISGFSFRKKLRENKRTLKFVDCSAELVENSKMNVRLTEIYKKIIDPKNSLHCGRVAEMDILRFPFARMGTTVTRYENGRDLNDKSVA